jgi:hypothetical protein
MSHQILNKLKFYLKVVEKNLEVEQEYDVIKKNLEEAKIGLKKWIEIIEGQREEILKNPETTIVYKDFLKKYLTGEFYDYDPEPDIDDDLELGYSSEYIMEKYHFSPQELSYKIKYNY